MSKAVLVMDMPSSCEKCILKNYVGKDCDVVCEVKGMTQSYEDAYKGKPIWCPLKPMPEKRDTKYNPTRNPYITEGYNACIDELLKREEG